MKISDVYLCLFVPGKKNLGRVLFDVDRRFSLLWMTFSIPTFLLVLLIRLMKEGSSLLHQKRERVYTIDLYIQYLYSNLCNTQCTDVFNGPNHNTLSAQTERGREERQKSGSDFTKEGWLLMLWVKQCTGQGSKWPFVLFCVPFYVCDKRL